MQNKQEINLLLKFDSKSGAFQSCKIIRNLKDIIKKSSVSLIKIEDDTSDRNGSCDFCANIYEIFLYQMHDNDGVELEQKTELFENSEPIVIKEEVFAEPILLEKIEDEDSVEEIKKVAKKKAKAKPKKHKKSVKKVPETTKDGYLKCDVCKTEFHSRKSLGHHFPYCNGSNLGRYRGGPNPSCSFCKKSFTYWSSARTHEKRIHTKTINYTCEVCGFTTNSKDSFDHHRLRDHTQKKNVICDLCQYRCSHKNNMRSHMKLKHLKVNTHICEICAKLFPDGTALKLHLMHKHSDVRNFPCATCQKAFK